jgi:hypothetical protein
MGSWRAVWCLNIDKLSLVRDEINMKHINRKSPVKYMYVSERPSMKEDQLKEVLIIEENLKAIGQFEQGIHHSSQNCYPAMQHI